MIIRIKDRRRRLRRSIRQVDGTLYTLLALALIVLFVFGR